MIAVEPAISVHSSFPNCGLSRAQWDSLLAQCPTPSVNLSWPWLSNWWNCLGHGRLLLTVARSGDQPVAVAPLFASGDRIYNLCPEDALDLLGDTSDPVLLAKLLETARQSVANCVGFRFYFIPDHSPTGERLCAAAHHLGWSCHDEGAIQSPFIDIAKHPQHALACTRKKSLVRHENYFQREGSLCVRHFRSAEDVLPQLDEFFDQHIARRAATPHASLFNNPVQRDYYHNQTRSVGPAGWLRFTRVDWNGRPIAFHYGLCYQHRFLFGIPSFDIRLAHRSPGEVLLRHLILAAIEENARSFDFGIGNEPYKSRFATDTAMLRTWRIDVPNSQLRPAPASP